MIIGIHGSFRYPRSMVASIAKRAWLIDIYVSEGHNFFGHHGRAPSRHPMRRLSEVRAHAGRGLEGDRFFDYKVNYKGQVTLFAMEVFEELCRFLNRTDLEPWAMRRNLIIAGVDLNDLIGRRFLLQEVELEGVEECRPCSWMEQACGPGAEEFLRGRGGLRARILSDGILRTDRVGQGASELR